MVDSPRTWHKVGGMCRRAQGSCEKCRGKFFNAMKCGALWWKVAAYFEEYSKMMGGCGMYCGMFRRVMKWEVVESGRKYRKVVTKNGKFRVKYTLKVNMFETKSAGGLWFTLK